MQLPSLINRVTRCYTSRSRFFLSFPCVSKYIHIYPRWSFWIGFRVCSRTLCHGSMVIALFPAEKGLPGSLPCLLRRRNGAEVCVFYLVSEIVSAQYFFESLSEPKAQWLPACPAGSRVWMTTVQSGRLVMGNQTRQRAGGNKNRVLLAIDCFYCNCFLSAFMALFINRVHAFSAQGWKIAAVALLLSIFLAWLTQGWWFWPLGPVILTG